MDVRIILSAISCPGRNHPEKSVRNAAVIWLKKEISWFVQTKNAVMSQL